ncbi:MAG: hypothetical protein COA50_07420 [Flavobacteriaceae bacterium]|nr:MAG: hypothetical protein COA50_07420 [Flavobacteriaceae bacterium]
MELKEFIKEVVLEVIHGVKAAQIEINDRNIKTIINPTRDQSMGVSKKGSIYDYNSSQEIEIDASITINEEGKDKISLHIIPCSYNGSKESVSRVKFSLPILLPAHELPEDFYD